MAMIQKIDRSYLLSFGTSSYLISFLPIGKPILDYYGSSIGDGVAGSLFRPTLLPGRAVCYSKEEPSCSLSFLPLETSTQAKGDFLTPSLLLEGGSPTPVDFRLSSSRIEDRPLPPEGYPWPRNVEQELILTLEDEANSLKLELHYLTFEGQNVLGRYAKIINEGTFSYRIRRFSSFSLSLLDPTLVLHIFRGGWIDEFHEESIPLTSAITSLHSSAGSSSDLHNPFFYVQAQSGECYGFNLLYSGDHEEILQTSPMGFARISCGIDSENFLYPLAPGESFSSPLAVLSHGDSESEMTSSFHRFIRSCLLPESHVGIPRPIVYNNWEATYFDFDEPKLRSLAGKAASLGVECFVLDDGWFGKRDNDRCSLGDWEANRKKLPHGLRGISDFVHKKGMLFGLWLEPEAISPDSELFLAHPDWAISSPGIPPSLGRNQLLLDLTKKEVADYLFQKIGSLLEEGVVDFVKWDYNRAFSDAPSPSGNYAHDYIMALYSLLRRIREKFPALWMENCASGGSRNDLGMFCFFDTGWVSDNTDSFSRAIIQKGMVKGYPPCLMSNHVSAKTSHQTLRKTSFADKFDVASFGVLGYELNLKELSPLEEKEIRSQIAYYKEIRKTCQFGEYRLLQDFPSGQLLFQSLQDGERILVSCVRFAQTPNPGYRRLPKLNGEKGAIYHFQVRPRIIDLRKFGGLVNMVSPIHVKEDGALIHFLSERKGMEGERFEGDVSGEALSAGALYLPQEWNGTGLNEGIAVILDFGARLYRFEKKQ